MGSSDETSKEGEHPIDETIPDSTMDTKTRERCEALRNHQISFEDAIDPNAERVFKLQRYDVVFGRGRGYQNHPGNQRLRNMIESYKTQYHSLKRDGKRKLVASVYQEILDGGARFLKKLDTDDGEDIWVIVDRPIALQKVSHTMRCRKSIIRQLDEDGNVPEAVGGPPRLAPSGSTMEPANHGCGFESMFGNVASARVASLMGNQVDMRPTSRSQPSLSGLEAQRVAALDRYGALSSMASIVPTGAGYQAVLRREQLMRETMMLRQMGDLLALNSASIATALPRSQGGFLGASLAYRPGQNRDPGLNLPTHPIDEDANR